MKDSAAPQRDFDMYVPRGVRYCRKEEDDSLEKLYAKGYLPYSGTADLNDVFYNARSARVVLPQFTLTSENRRVAKKFDEHFSKLRIPLRNFTLNEELYTFILNYFAERHGPNVMPRERLELLLTSDLISTIVEYRQDTRIAGYVLEIESGSMRHYWYSAYDMALARQSLGLWLMLDCTRDAAASGFTHYYLGTVYGAKALYKTNFEPLEWWDGERWHNNAPALKELARKD